MLNNLMATNSHLFSGIIKRSAYVNQLLLNTNNPLPMHYSTDGLHFLDLTNGCYANKLIIDQWLGEGDFGARPLYDFSGNLLLPGNVINNWTGFGQ